MNNLSDANAQVIPAEKPYKRRIWVTVLLSILGLGLPLIYCGNLWGGIILTLILLIIEAVLYVFLSIIASYYLLIAGIAISIIAFILILIYNINYTIKTNRINKARVPRVWIRIIAIFIATAIVSEIGSAITKANFIEAYKIPSEAMENTLVVGDYLLASKGIDTGRLRRGDLIIYKDPRDNKSNWIKRLVAIGGDTVEIVNKQLYVNHKSIPLPPEGLCVDSLHSYPYSPQDVKQGWGPGLRDNMPIYIIPPGKYFVLGDNRDNSADSRFYGPLDKSEVLGVARFIHFSWDSEHLKIRWNRMGKRLDDYRQPS